MGRKVGRLEEAAGIIFFKGLSRVGRRGGRKILNLPTFRFS